MNALAVSIVFYTFLVLPCCAEKCVFPSETEDIDWNRMSGTWYEGLRTKNEAMYKDSSCSCIQDITPTNNGVAYNFTVYFHNSPYKQTFKGHDIRQRPGVYKKDEHEGNSVNFIKDFVVLTDYDNYFVRLACSEAGRWFVLGAFRKKQLVAEDILPALDRLANYGFYEKLYSTGCATTVFLE